MQIKDPAVRINTWSNFSCRNFYLTLPLLDHLADELLASDLLPRKIELEQRYLAEALEILTSSQVGCPNCCAPTQDHVSNKFSLSFHSLTHT